MKKEEKLANDFVELVTKYREAQNNPEDYKKINNVAKQIRSTFAKIREIGDPAREVLSKHLDTQPIEISSFISAYLIRFKTDKCFKILRKASKLSGHVGYGAEQTIKRWEEKDWHLDEV